MEKYKRLTKNKPFEKLDLKDELGYSYIYKRLQELENKLEKRDIIELPCKVEDIVFKSAVRILSQQEEIERLKAENRALKDKINGN